MMQHLLRRLVFDVPLLNEHAKMPLKVSTGSVCSYLITESSGFVSYYNMYISQIHHVWSLMLENFFRLLKWACKL